MSSLVDAVLASDNLDLDLGIGKKPAAPLTSDNLQPPPSSSRPRPAPSESAAPYSDAAGFPDDELAVSARGRNPLDRDVPKVIDVAGQKVEQSFEEFLET